MSHGPTARDLRRHARAPGPARQSGTRGPRRRGPVRRGPHREVRDRPRDLERAIEPATRESVEVDRRCEDLARLRRDPRLASRDGTRGAGRCSGTRGTRGGDAAGSGPLDAFADRGRRLARLFAQQLSPGEARDRPAGCRRGRAAGPSAAPGRSAAIVSADASTRPDRPSNPHGQGFAAATRVNRAGNTARAHRARDDDATVLEGLAEPLERVAAELRELVEEQHAMVRERDLARAQVRGAAAERAPPWDDGVVRRAERPRVISPSRPGARPPSATG